MGNVKRKVFVFLSMSLIFLIGIVFIFDPNNSFSKLIKEDFSFSSELYTINLNSTSTGVPDNIKSIYSEDSLLYKYVEVLLNYKNDDGVSLEVLDSDWGNVDYQCGEATCEFFNVSEYWEDIVKDDYWSFTSYEYSENYSAKVPVSVTYKGEVYNLDHYITNISSFLESDFCKPYIKLNNQITLHILSVKKNISIKLKYFILLSLHHYSHQKLS